MELLSRYRTFGGSTEFYTHASESCSAPMRFSVFVPPQAAARPVPVLYWLSGLTCTEENFMVKAGAQSLAAEHGILIVAPDTSPRNTGIENEAKDWDVGTGAGFYVNATQPKWAKHYRMFDYVAHELPKLIRDRFPVRAEAEGIFGHSMGGHGALVLALSQPGRYRSISAFAPISAPMQCPWGQKAFREYLGEDKATWERYDSSELVAKATVKSSVLVDQGGADKFLNEQLMPWKLREAAERNSYPLTLRTQDGYDHSYYFIATFMKVHLAFHASQLNG